MRPTVFFRPGDADAITVVNAEDPDNVFSIDALAAEVFRALDARRSFQKIVGLVRDRHPGLPPRFEADVRRLLIKLLKENLIAIVE
ncbi:MAG: PqqD family protein [Elusimicrobiota bacterium]